MIAKSVLIFSLFVILSVLFYPTNSQAQRASAEFITSYEPGTLKSGEQVKDGIQNLFYLDGRLYVSNVWAGLQILDVSNVSEPVEIGSYRSNARINNVYVDEQYAYLANALSGVTILEVTDAAATRVVSTINTKGDAYWVVANYPIVYVAEETHGINIYDITNLAEPQLVGGFDTPGWAWGIDLAGDILFVADKNGGLVTIDVSDPANPIRKGQLTEIKNAKTVEIHDNLAYVGNGPDGLAIVDISNAEFPKLISALAVDGFVYNASKFGNSVFLANEVRRRVEIIDVTDPKNPVKEGDYTYKGKVYAAIKYDVYVYVAADISTLILRHNHPPVLTQIEEQTVDEVATLTIIPDGYDPDGDEIYYLVENLPQGASFDTLSGQIVWTPDFEQSGMYPEVTLTAREKTDSQLSTSTIFTINVNHVNRNPVLPDIPDTTVLENQALVLMVPEGNDPDVEDRGRLTYSATNLPEGAEFDSLSRVFSWTSAYDQSGIYTIDFAVHDGAGGVMRDAATINVIHVDRKPHLVAIEPQSVDENTELTFQIEGSDPDAEDQDKLSYLVENLPEGAVFDAQTAIFSWTPTYDQSGEYAGLLFVFTAGALTDSILVDVVVIHINRKPVMDAIADHSINEDELLTFTVLGNDPDVEDEGKLTYSAANLPEGSGFNADSLKFTWKPSFEQSGIHSDLLFMIHDPSGLTDTVAITIAVNHVNRLPVLAEIEAKTINENELLTFELMGADLDAEDQEKLVYTAEGLPEGALLEGPIFSWTPGFDQSGEYTITFTVSDGELSESKEVVITVVHINRPPVLAEISAQTVNENEPLTFAVTGSDPDQEDQTGWSITAQNLPEGAVYDTASAQFSWTPTFMQSGAYTVTFVMTDAAGLTDQKDVLITVNHVNRTPVFAELAPQVLDENTPLNFTLTPATDPDVENEGNLIYTAENLPTGANFDDKTLTLSWTPGYDQAGEYTINFNVADGEFSVTQPLVVTVNHINRPPEIGDIANQTIGENEDWRFTLPVSDPDAEDDGKLTVTVDNLPQGASFDAASLVITWTPTYDQTGSYENILVGVSDPAGLSVQKSFNITVNNTNRPPVIDPISDVTVDPGQAVSFTASGSDPDNDDLQFSASGLPSGASIDGSGAFSWTPSDDQAGSHAITIKVSDGTDSAETKVNIKVNAPPPPPPAPADTSGQ